MPRRFVVAVALAVACLGAALAAPFTCGRAPGVQGVPGGGSQARPSPGSSDDGAARPATRAAPSPAPSDLAPIAGHGCLPGRDSVACSPDGLEEIACAGNVWRTIQSCRGPGHCKGEASKLSCDTGVPQPGDACIAAKATPRCLDAQRLLTCTEGKWLPTACPDGTACTPFPVDTSGDARMGLAACR